MENIITQLKNTTIEWQPQRGSNIYGIDDGRRCDPFRVV